VRHKTSPCFDATFAARFASVERDERQSIGPQLGFGFVASDCIRSPHHPILQLSLFAIPAILAIPYKLPISTPKNQCSAQHHLQRWLRVEMKKDGWDVEMRE
jgi:hypothetical protein